MTDVRAERLQEEPLAPPRWRQLGVFICDGSESMTWELQEPDDSLADEAPSRTKAAAVDRALRDVVNRMQASRKAANFALAFVAFHDRVSSETPPRELSDISASDGFDPTAHGMGGTAIATGIDSARGIVEEFLRNEGSGTIPASAVVVLLSDGDDTSANGAPDHRAVMKAAKELKDLPNTQLACCFFATKGQPASGAGLLEAIASKADLYQITYNAEQIRKFFLASVTVKPQAALTAGDKTTD